MKRREDRDHKNRDKNKEKEKELDEGWTIEEFMLNFTEYSLSIQK